MGNRGCIHTEDRKLGTRRWAHRSWVTCRLDFRGQRREVMAPNSYTELFFLDEATALAAGHRPCGECRRAEFRRFRDLWLKENGKRPAHEATSITRIDRFMHAERINRRREQLTWRALLDELPSGAMVRFAEEDAVWLLWAGRLLRWAAQYRPMVHQSAEIDP